MMAHIGKILTFSNMLESTRIHNYVFVITHSPVLNKFTMLYSMHNRNNLRFIHMKRTLKAITVLQKDIKEENIDKEKLPEIIKYVNDKQIIYSSHIADQRVNLNYGTRRKLENKFKAEQDRKIKAAATPLIIEKMLSLDKKTSEELEPGSVSSARSTVSYPYSHTHNINFENITLESNTEVTDSDLNNIGLTVREDIACRMHAYEDGVLQKLESTPKKVYNENTFINFKDEYFFNDSVSEDFAKGLNTETFPLRKEHDTADPTIPVSDVPCGGCGAHLHCQAPALPGFIPKEDFVGLNRGELRGVLCQRCYFLRYHKMVLNVRVSPSVYPKILEPIKNVKALILVVVDLLDVPCSIWPNFIDIIGTRRPVVVVGNKVDLLPADGKNHLRRIEDSLAAAVDKTDLGRANIRHLVLVSAQTGFGIENLITKIHNIWSTQGDIYILGCTNSGKSTLFNTLLGSDLCKTSASSLIQRATTSCWPGTTLNMLKFPILRPSKLRLYLRVKRLKEQQKIQSQIAKLKPAYTNSISVGTLSGHIGRTFDNFEEPEERSDPFSTNMRTIPKEQRKILGIDTNDPKYSLGKWCFDTPGTVQPDQLINLLTHDELIKVLPSRLIQPSTFCLQTGQSLFIGGLARLDLIYSPQPVRFTVFRSEHLPITVVRTVDASAFYRKYLGSTLLGVPLGDEERLNNWPAIAPKNMRTFSISKGRSCADVVLSSAGWVAITGIWKHVIELRGWTPGGRGIYLRDPPILPLAIKLRGPRIERSPACKAHSIFVPK